MRFQGVVLVVKQDPRLERGHAHLTELPPTEFYAVGLTRSPGASVTNEGDIDHHGCVGRGSIQSLLLDTTITLYLDNILREA